MAQIKADVEYVPQGRWNVGAGEAPCATQAASRPVAVPETSVDHSAARFGKGGMAGRIGGALASSRSSACWLVAAIALSTGRDGAGDGIRTRDILLGKQTLCQLSYSRSGGPESSARRRSGSS